MTYWPWCVDGEGHEFVATTVAFREWASTGCDLAPPPGTPITRKWHCIKCNAEDYRNDPAPSCMTTLADYVAALERAARHTLASAQKSRGRRQAGADAEKCYALAKALSEAELATLFGPPNVLVISLPDTEQAELPPDR